MGLFILRRFGVMVLTAICLTFVVFFLTNLYPNLEKLAKTQGNARMTDAEVASWLDRNGYGGPLILRYGEWLGVVPGWTREGPEGEITGRCIDSDTPADIAPTFCGLLQGDLGYSTVSDDEVSNIIGGRLALTGKLMFWAFAVMVPAALIIGVLAGMREGSRMDRSLSTVSIASTATPEYVSGVIFIVLLASSTTGLSPWLSEMGWIEGRTLFLGSARSAMEGITFWNFTLPVMTIALYGMGYIARMTRASMAEVMTAQYIRTARLKGVSFRNIVLKHALRNALIAPFTVIMLQFPWLLTGVVIVETLFNYNGFGWTLVQAASNNDIELLLACSIVAVFVVLVTQLISDIGYVFLNPRIRIS
ncbi:Oligopeptide/dipeptide ABC transporter, permease protein [Roseibacterium elongatum DSM 19469]|uniref:Oligopeptide/dipeptide ABC transporter, permease protein n=1 Tax=Roseicyclus elongatus DSM 19469 TaxID=1294273 RepID=W8RUW5_9RHOB|nr:ABC transporter permease [Roseibacterium elongatum]AHM04989.1 Oligopeptide/dipeptide ABC transporter, permease protein [Roseibacterium elongatum DSM 19469]